MCQWVTKSPGGKETLKHTVRNFLEATQLDLAVLDASGPRRPYEVTLAVSMEQDDLLSLRRFILNDEGSESDIQDILRSSFRCRTVDVNIPYLGKHYLTV